MAKKKKSINLNDPEIRKRRQLSQKGYHRKVFMKLAKRVHADAKKRGEKPTWNESQKFASDFLYQDYKNELVSHIDLQEVDKIVVRVIKEREQGIPSKPAKAKEQCGSVFSIPQAEIINFEWWEIQNKLFIIPGDVMIRVNGGDLFGYTDIQPAGEVSSEEITNIVSSIRGYFENQSGPTWSGDYKVRPGRNDDGQNCSYFIDFVLEIDGQQFGISSTLGETDVSRTFGAPTYEDIENLQISKAQRTQLQKERNKQRAEGRKEKEKQESAKSRKRPTAQPKPETRTNYEKLLEMARKDFDDGISTKAQYAKEKDRIYKMIEKDQKDGK